MEGLRNNRKSIQWELKHDTPKGRGHAEIKQRLEWFNMWGKHDLHGDLDYITFCQNIKYLISHRMN